jgi:hypothetical protein
VVTINLILKMSLFLKKVLRATRWRQLELDLRVLLSHWPGILTVFVKHVMMSTTKMNLLDISWTRINLLILHGDRIFPFHVC